MLTVWQHVSRQSWQRSPCRSWKEPSPQPNNRTNLPTSSLWSSRQLPFISTNWLVLTMTSKNKEKDPALESQNDTQTTLPQSNPREVDKPKDAIHKTGRVSCLPGKENALVYVVLFLETEDFTPCQTQLPLLHLMISHWMTKILLLMKLMINLH